jgi:protein lifeguard
LPSFQVQLAVTIGFIALFQFHDGTVLYALKNQWLLNMAMLVTLALTLLMSFSTSIRREAPLNIIVLGAYTVAQGFMVGLLTSFYEIDDVFYAIGLTAAIVFGLAVYASSTKEDFTMKGGMFASALMALTIGSLISIFYRGEFFNLLLSVGFAGIFSCYLVYDLQMIMGSKSLSISAEEYIFAALSLYVDIIRIFMELLKILKYLNENSQNQRKRKRN